MKTMACTNGGDGRMCISTSNVPISTLIMRNTYSHHHRHQRMTNSMKSCCFLPFLVSFSLDNRLRRQDIHHS